MNFNISSTSLASMCTLVAKIVDVKSDTGQSGILCKIEPTKFSITGYSSNGHITVSTPITSEFNEEFILNFKEVSKMMGGLVANESVHVEKDSKGIAFSQHDGVVKHHLGRIEMFDKIKFCTDKANIRVDITDWKTFCDVIKFCSLPNVKRSVGIDRYRGVVFYQDFALGWSNTSFYQCRHDLPLPTFGIPLDMCKVMGSLKSDTVTCFCIDTKELNRSTDAIKLNGKTDDVSWELVVRVHNVQIPLKMFQTTFQVAVDGSFKLKTPTTFSFNTAELQFAFSASSAVLSNQDSVVSIAKVLPVEDGYNVHFVGKSAIRNNSGEYVAKAKSSVDLKDQYLNPPSILVDSVNKIVNTFNKSTSTDVSFEYGRSKMIQFSNGRYNSILLTQNPVR